MKKLFVNILDFTPQESVYIVMEELFSIILYKRIDFLFLKGDLIFKKKYVSWLITHIFFFVLQS